MFDTINNINEYVMLIQLMDSPGNVSHSDSFSGVWIYDSNDEIALPLVKYYLYCICDSYDDDDFDAYFDLFYTVRCINTK